MTNFKMCKQFQHEGRYTVNKQINKCSMSLVIREVQTKTTIRNHLTVTGVIVIKIMDINSIDEDVEKLEPMHCW